MRGSVASRRSFGAVRVWRSESAKLYRLRRVQLTFVACAVLPFLFTAVVRSQSAAPEDTLFGQWVHESGFAVPLVILSFAGQWALPLLAVVVAGDIFSSEDHWGTWKLLLTRSRSRNEVFAGKVAATGTYILLALSVLAAAGIAAGVVVGAQPIVGLGGQLVPSGHALWLVVASWALQLPPMLGFGALGLVSSVAARNSAVGIGVPVLAGVLMQVLTLVTLPVPVRIALLSSAFESWHGLWLPRPGFGPLGHGLVTSGVWTGVALFGAWLLFSRRAVRVG